MKVKTIFINILICLNLFFLPLGVVSAAAPLGVVDEYDIDENDFLIVVDPGVLENDTDADNDSLTAILDQDVSHGTLSLAADGSFTYEPDAEFDGEDVFTYVANDGTANSATTTVTITVNDTDPVDSTAPTIPDSIIADEISASFVRIRWNASTDASGVAGYRVYRSSGGDFSQIAEVQGLSYADIGRESDTTYQYKVSAFDASDNESGLSSTLTIETEPSDENILLLDTGTPASAASGRTLSLDLNGYARKVVFDEAQMITNIEVYLRSFSTNAVELTLVLYESNGEVPDTNTSVEIGTLSFTPGSLNEAGWRGLNGLEWYVDAGEYWIALEYREDNSFDGFIPIISTSYIIDGASKEDNAGYIEGDTEYGFRIYGSTDLILDSVAVGSITSSGATITWTSNRPADSVVHYGTTASHGSIASSVERLTDHSINLTGLSPNTTYYYVVVSKDIDDVISTSSQSTFITSSVSSGGGGGGGGGGESRDTSSLGKSVAVDDVSSLKYERKGKTITLTWKNPLDKKYSKTRVYRAKTATSSSFVRVYQGNGSKFVDKNRNIAQDHRYKVVTVSVTGTESSGKFIVGKIANSSTGSDVSFTDSSSGADTKQCSAVPTNMRTLVIGMTGSDVKELQIFLNQQGYTVAQTGAGSTGNETMYYGPATHMAYTRFLASCAGTNTAVVIPVSSPFTTYNRDLTIGSAGTDVIALQDMLIQQGYLIIPTSQAKGYFGNLTRDALIKFQIDKGIVPATGYFGPVTRAYIEN